jgi:hypothetical protein
LNCFATVAGAKTGRPTVERLLEKGTQFAQMVRLPASMGLHELGAEIFVGEMADLRELADLGGDRIDVEAAAMKKKLRAFVAQIPEIGQRRFAEHRFTTAMLVMLLPPATERARQLSATLITTPRTAICLVNYDGKVCWVCRK